MTTPDLDVHDDDDRFDDAVRAAAVDVDPPPGFADAVVARHLSRHRRSWTRPFVAALTGAAAAAALTFMVVVPKNDDVVTHGTIVAGAQAQTVALSFGRAQLLPQAELVIDGTGDDVSVRLVRGRAFFHVDEPARVHVADSVVVVDRTASFSLSLEPSMSTLALKPLPTTLTFAAGGLVGALLTAIAVHEGDVRVDNAHGQLALAAGEHGVVVDGSAPTRGDAEAAKLALAEKRLQLVLSSLTAGEAAEHGNTAGLVSENQRLRQLVAKQDEELQLLDADRLDREGAPRAFPADLEPRFTQQQLQTQLTTALREAGIEGEVVEVDCAEYPCVVWGEMHSDTAKLTEQLKKTAAFSAYTDDAAAVRGWASNDDGVELFAITLTKRGEGEAADAEREELMRRVRHRTESAFDAHKPASWEKPSP